MYEHNDDFMIVLPSNTPSSIKNTPSKYLTTFDQSIQLNGNWEVALVEINFKNSLKTINEDFVTVNKYKSVIPTAVQNQPLEFPIINKIKKDTGADEKIIGTKEIISQKKTGDDSEPKKKIISSEKYCPVNDNDIVLQPRADKLFVFYYYRGYITLRNTSGHDMNLKINHRIAFNLGFIDNTGKYNESLADTYHTFPTILKTQTLKASFKPTMNKQNEIIISDKNLTFSIRYNSEIQDEQVYKFSPKPGAYASVEDLMKEFNDDEDFKKYYKIIFDKRVNRIEIESIIKDDNYHIMFHKGLNDVLGFSKTDYKITTKQKAEMQVNLLRGISTLFIYSDICEFIHVGNTLTPLLRTVAFNSKIYGDQVYINYSNPIYVKVNKSFINSIEILVCDSTGETIPFVEGMTTLTLHFRRV